MRQHLTGLLVCLSSFPLASQAVAAHVTAASGRSADVQAAVDAAKDGDVVLIPAGTHVWTKAVKVGTVDWVKGGPVTKGQKHLTLQGAGIDRTIIVNEVPVHPNGIDDSLFVLYTQEGKPFRVTGMTLKGGAAETGQLAAMRVLGTGKQVRVDHVKFHHLQTRGLYVNGEIFGVIDHCEFLINAWKQAIWVGHNAWGGHNYGDGSWASPLSLGTEKALFIEDNLFRAEGAATATATVDSWMGGRWVFRHNQVENMTIGNHGTESSSVFSDSYTRPAGRFAWNTGDALKIMKAKACLDGVGRSTGLLLSGDNPLPQQWPQQALEPLYEWNNTLNGKDADLHSRSTLIQEGREYYNDTPRPGYTPYAYPHPLIAEFDKAGPPR